MEKANRGSCSMPLGSGRPVRRERRSGRIDLIWFGMAVSMHLALAGTALAQQPAPQADPEDFGLVLPDADPVPAGGRRVLVPTDSGDPVVAEVLVEVADRLVVVLPNGRLNSVPAREATVTERPFVPATIDELKAELGSRFQGFKFNTTRRYLYVHNTSPQFFQGTSRILETMYPNLFAWCKRQKIPVREPSVPLVVIMFRTQEEFDRYHRMPEGVVAYYSGVSNHVVMYEESALVKLAPDLALKQSISTIAHEGVHQILHNIGVQQRLSNWPIWISEGLAEYFAPTTVDRRVRWKGVGLTNDLRMKELEEYLNQGARGGPGEIVRPTVEAEGLTATGYAAAWALTHYLAERRKAQFFAYLADVSGTAPLEQRPAETNLALFQKHFGDDFRAMEQALVKHLQKLPYVDPIANQTHYVVMLEVDSGDGTQRRVALTTSPTSAQQWQREQLATVPAPLQNGARFAIQVFPNRTAAAAYAERWLNR